MMLKGETVDCEDTRFVCLSLDGVSVEESTARTNELMKRLILSSDFEEQRK
jgi:hypothetical protein